MAFTLTKAAITTEKRSIDNNLYRYNTSGQKNKIDDRMLRGSQWSMVDGRPGLVYRICGDSCIDFERQVIGSTHHSPIRVAVLGVSAEVSIRCGLHFVTPVSAFTVQVVAGQALAYFAGGIGRAHRPSYGSASSV